MVVQERKAFAVVLLLASLSAVLAEPGEPGAKGTQTWSSDTPEAIVQKEEEVAPDPALTTTPTAAAIPAPTAAAGSPNFQNPAKRRSKSVGDDTPVALSLGFLFQVTEHFGVDLYYRQMSLKTDATFTEVENG